ncbi:hypothetical protein D3C80_679550 [compost metagenome]
MFPVLVTRPDQQFVLAAEGDLPHIDHQRSPNQAFLGGVLFKVILALLRLVAGEALEFKRHAAQLKWETPHHVQYVVRIELNVLGLASVQPTMVPFHGVKQADIQVAGHIELECRAHHQHALTGRELSVLVVEFDPTAQRHFLDRTESH